MQKNTRKIHISVLQKRTSFFLFWSLLALNIMLGLAYLFVMNHSAIRGYRLTLETEANAEIKRSLANIDSQIAKKSANKYVLDAQDIQNMIVQERNRYLVMKKTYTAQK